MNIFKRLFSRPMPPDVIHLKPLRFHRPESVSYEGMSIEDMAAELKRQVTEANRLIFEGSDLIVEIGQLQDYLTPDLFPLTRPTDKCLVMVNFRKLGGIMRPLSLGSYQVFAIEEKL